MAPSRRLHDRHARMPEGTRDAPRRDVKNEVTLALLLAACTPSHGPRTTQYASVQETLRVARSEGADRDPAATVYIGLAEDELATARHLAADGEYSHAESVLARAQADAEHAIQLGRSRPHPPSETKGAAPPPHERDAKEHLTTLAEVEEAPNATVVTVSDSVLFRKGTADLLPTSAATLDRVAELATARGEISVRAYDPSARLAEERAAAIESALGQRGVTRVRTKGFGGDVERRVELMVRGAPAP